MWLDVTIFIYLISNMDEMNIGSMVHGSERYSHKHYEMMLSTISIISQIYQFILYVCIVREVNCSVQCKAFILIGFSKGRWWALATQRNGTESKATESTVCIDDFDYDCDCAFGKHLNLIRNQWIGVTFIFRVIHRRCGRTLHMYLHSIFISNPNWCHWNGKTNTMHSLLHRC